MESVVAVLLWVCVEKGEGTKVQLQVKSIRSRQCLIRAGGPWYHYAAATRPVSYFDSVRILKHNVEDNTSRRSQKGTALCLRMSRPCSIRKIVLFKSWQIQAQLGTRGSQKAMN